MTRPLQHTGPAANGDGGTQILPFDWEADRRELEDRLQELSFPSRSQPWVWIRTLEPCPDRGDARFRLIAQAEPPPAQAFGEDVDAPLGAPSLFTPAWSGYHYEAIGRLHRYRRRDVDLTAEPPPGRAPTLRMFEPGTRHLWLETAL
jgi:hypothetical protein